MALPATQELIRRAPKVLLHDHLDGGLRPGTVRELARRSGHRLPVDDEEELRRWFDQTGRGGDLPRYLEVFEHTVAVLQAPDNLVRVTREAAEDLEADGVVHAELRYAPELSTTSGTSLEAVLDALGEGAAQAPGTIGVRFLVCVMRQADRGEEVVEAAVRARDRGVPIVGVDLAGPEAGHPARAHARALGRALDAGLALTLHAGEAAGLDSITDALDQGARRLGHGVRLVDDLSATDELGPVARRVVAEDVTLELCPTSNVQTGAVASLDDHPLERLRAAGIPVTVSTDNRLMSNVGLTGELVGAADRHGWSMAQIEEVTRTAARAAFLPAEERTPLLERLDRGFAALEP